MNLSHSRIAAQNAILLAGACLQWAAMATESSPTHWRCGNTYTDQPCAGGKPLDLDDARSPQQQRDADQATRDARGMADRLERDRLRQEAAQGPGQASLIDNAPRHAPSSPRDDALRKAKARKDTYYVNPQEPRPSRKKKKKVDGN